MKAVFILKELADYLHLTGEQVTDIVRKLGEKFNAHVSVDVLYSFIVNTFEGSARNMAFVLIGNYWEYLENEEASKTTEQRARFRDLVNRSRPQDGNGLMPRDGLAYQYTDEELKGYDGDICNGIPVIWE